MKQRIFDAPKTDRDDESRTITLSGRETATDNMERRLLVDRARQVLQQRRKRSELFGPAMFGEPGWDILLILYTEEDESRPTISRLATAAGSPMSTGLRWLNHLESQQWICRRPHPTDGRVDLVELTDKARNALDSYFSEAVMTG